ncbi:MAG TPA: leucyl aminopeptidase, partial [Mycobacteriales bacterium]|nr:leucyl aminopeptidase [Mycobacteriales bacterium]
RHDLTTASVVHDLPSLGLAATPPPGGADVLLVLPTRPGDPVSVAGSVPGDVRGVLEREKAKGEAGELVSLPTGDDQRVLLLGTGDASPKAWRKAGAALARRAKGQRALVLDLRELRLDDEGLRALAEGLLLASYRFTRKDVEPRPLREITVVVSAPERLRPALDRVLAVVRATAAARDLVNTPPDVKSPSWLADQAVRLLKGLDVRVRDDAELAREGWGGVLAVGQGSSRPPRVVEVTYDGGGARHLVLVGKGITFDTGGLSIKPNASMTTMKMDMSGAAAVLAAVRAAADLKLPVKVTAIACIAENMPSGAAQRPSDVLRQYDGTTVEVLNTDAEGRLVLADGLAYAVDKLAPDALVDVATLTGAMEVAMGKRVAGYFASDERLARQLEAASDASGERIWRFPLVEDYRQALRSDTADLRNIGDPKLKLQGGAITAALFLQTFTGEVPWAHVDIAGPAWAVADDDELTKGGTAFGVRLLVRWLEGQR